MNTEKNKKKGYRSIKIFDDVHDHNQNQNRFNDKSNNDSNYNQQQMYINQNVIMIHSKYNQIDMT